MTDTGEKHKLVDCVQRDSIHEIKSDIRGLRKDVDDVKESMNGKLETVRTQSREDAKEIRDDVRRLHDRVDRTTKMITQGQEATTKEFVTIRRDVTATVEKVAYSRGRLAGLIALVSVIIAGLTFAAGLLADYLMAKGSP